MPARVIAAVVATLAMSAIAPAVSAAAPRGLSPDALEQYWASQYPKSQVQSALGRSFSNAAPDPTGEVIAKARPDECTDTTPTPPWTFTAFASPCPDGLTPKVNQAYVWGLTLDDEGALWMGTMSNTHCLVIQGYLGITSPITTDSYTCQAGSGPKSPLPPFQALGDFRPPQIFRVRTADRAEGVEPGTGQRPPLANQQNMGALVTDGDPSNGDTDAALLRTTLGLRSAGDHDGVVFLAGPAAVGGGVNIFAFEAESGDYLGSAKLADDDWETGDPRINNIRRWVAYGDALYTTVGLTDGTGAVLKWTGTPADPFSFEYVGTTPTAGADLVGFAGRIWVTTWPGSELGGGSSDAVAGLYYTRSLGEHDAGDDEDELGELSPSTAPMGEAWRATDYEPDEVTARTYGGGALGVVNGRLVWGTMHVPGLATFAHMAAGHPTSSFGPIIAALGSLRAIALFGGTEEDLVAGGDGPRLLYGQRRLPVWNGGMNWSLEPNNMGQAPRLGFSGLGNLFNNYTWAMENTEEDGLFVGTMDWSYLLADGLASVIDIPVDVFDGFLGGGLGADLFLFPQGGEGYVRAVPYSQDGLGNRTNYGVRTLEADDDVLYAGMANPMNLLTAPGGPLGGWELQRLQPDGN